MLKIIKCAIGAAASYGSFEMLVMIYHRPEEWQTLFFVIPMFITGISYFWRAWK